MSVAARRHLRGIVSAQDTTLYSLWPSNPTPQITSNDDSASVELGVRFKTSAPAEVIAVRFYKSAQNIGTHVVSLWRSNGENIVSVTVTDETASGWQTMYLPTPVQISANTPYVASYLAPNGHYPSNDVYFVNNDVINGIISAPKSTAGNLNGLYKYTSIPACPTESFNDTNYWVDVIVRTTQDSEAPSAPVGLTGSAQGQWASLTWTPSNDNTGVERYIIYRDGSEVGASTAASFVDETTAASTAYTYTVRAVDFTGNQSLLSNSAVVTTGTNAAPIAAFITQVVGRLVFVDGTLSSDTDGAHVNYSWDFGDGTTSTQSVADHTYLTNGTYTIQLTVTDEQGAADTTLRDVTVDDDDFIANVINNPSLAGYPDQTNTGVPVGAVLTNMGQTTVEQDGQVIQNRLITGGLVIDADNVIIRNCHIICPSYYPIINYGTNLLIEDCEIEATTLDGTSCVAFGNYTIRRSNLHGAVDGTKSNENVIIEDCFIHDLGTGPDTHSDGTQTTSGNNVIIRHNTYRLGNIEGVNACIQFGNEGGMNTNWIIEDNIFDGGATTFNGSADPGNSSNIIIRNNRFTTRNMWGIGGLGGAYWFANYYDEDGTVAQNGR